MESLLSQQFVNQYVLLNSDDRSVSAQANQYILQAIKHPQILEHAMQMALTKTNSVKLQMLGAHLIYIKIENDCCKMELQEFFRLKQLIWLRLCDCQYEKGAENMLCSIMGVLIIVLYPQHWCNLVQEMINFMRSDIKRFNHGFIILQRAATELRNQSISRSLRLKAMKAFHQECNQLLQMFQFIIELDNSDINCKLMGVLQEWSNVNLPLLKSPIIIDFVLKQIMTESSIIRLGTLPTIKNALKHAFFGKKQKFDLCFNFQESGLTQHQMDSLNKIVEYLIQEYIWFYQSLQLYQQDQDLENYIQIISTILFSYSFLLSTPKGEEILQLPQFLFKSSFKKISSSTFNLWCSFYSLMQKSRNYARQLRVNELASEMLQVLLKKVALTKQQIKEEVNQNDQTRQFNQMGFFQYREAAILVFKAIHEFFLSYGQNKESGAQLFFNTILKHLNDTQKSIWVQLVFFIIQNCFGKGLDDNDYQVSKVLEILKQVLQFCGQQKDQVHELAVSRILTTIKDYRYQISLHPQLYLSALKFTIMYLTSENIGHNAVLSLDRLLQLSKQEIRNDFLQEVVDFYVKREFSSLSVKSKILSAIIKLNKKNENRELKLWISDRIIKKIENNLQTIHKISQQESLPNVEPYLSAITQISILCTNQSQIHLDQQNYGVFQKRLAQLSFTIMNQTVEYGLRNPQSYHDYKNLVKCAKKFEQIVRILPNKRIFWTCPQTLVQLMEKVFLLFQIKNLNLLLDHGKLVVVAAKLLKILPGKVSNKVDHWLKQNVFRINQFFFQYYELKCDPDFKDTDPDIIRAYFTLEEAFCIYNYQLFAQQIPQSILQFSILCLQKIIQKKLQKKVLSFILNYLERREVCQNAHEVGSWLTKNLISLSPILDSPCQTMLAKITIYVFKNMLHDSYASIISEAMENTNFDFANAKMKSIVAQYLSIFAKRQSVSYTKAIFSHLNQLKYSEKQEDEYAVSFSLIYQKWSKILESSSQLKTDYMIDYSDANSD